MDSRCAPRSILNDHPKDQLPNLFRRPFFSDRRPDSGYQPPIHAKTGLMPTNDGFRRDNDESFFPS